MNSLERIIIAIRTEFEDYIRLRTGDSYTSSDSAELFTEHAPSGTIIASGVPIEETKSNIIYDLIGGVGGVVGAVASYLPGYNSLPSLPNIFSTNKELTAEKVAEANSIIEICKEYQEQAAGYNKDSIVDIDNQVKVMFDSLSAIFLVKIEQATALLRKHSNQKPNIYDAKLAFVNGFINELKNDLNGDKNLLCALLKAELDQNILKVESKDGILPVEHFCHQDPYKNLPLNISSYMYSSLLSLKIDTYKRKEGALNAVCLLPSGPETSMKSIIEDKLVAFVTRMKELNDEKSGAKKKLEAITSHVDALIKEVCDLEDKSYPFINEFKDQLQKYSKDCKEFRSEVEKGISNKKISDKMSDKKVTTSSVDSSSPPQGSQKPTKNNVKPTIKA